MDNFFNNVKNIMSKAMKKLGKVITKAALPIILPIVLILVLISGLIYESTKQDASYKEGDMSNTPFAVTKYTSDVTIDKDGNITTSMTAKELWEEMIKNNGRVDEYLDGPEDLLKLMNAEIVTNFPDTRKNPDEEIDWDSLNKDIESNKAQGIIKFKRAKSDGTISTMTYVDPETFYKLVESYNQTQDESIKQEIINYFTIEEINSSSNNNNNEETSQKINSLDNVLFIGDSITQGLESSGLIPNATFYAQSSTKPSDWLSKVDTLPENSDSISCVCVMLGVNGTNEIEQMKQLIDALAEKYEGKTIFVQKVLPVANTYTQNDYNTMNQNIKNFNDTISSYCNGKSNVKFIDTSNGYVDESGNGKAELFDTMGLHPLNYEILKENIEKAITGTESTTSGSNSNITNSTSKYCVVVATWKETYTKREPVGEKNPEEQYSDGITTKEMTTEKIDYQKAVQGYTMPFDYLWALVVTGREKNFAMDLADLVYGSEIEITIHDNYEEIENIDTYTYINKTKIHTHDISTTIEIGLGYSTSNPTVTEEWEEGEERELEPTTYTIKNTVNTKTNTLDISLTKANVWIVNYSKEYNYEVGGTGPDGQTSGPQLLGKIEYPDTPNKTDNEDPGGIASGYSQTVLDKYNESGNASIKNISCTTDYYYYSEITVTNYNKTTSNKYVSSPANTIEKTDPKSEEDNFVTLFLKNDNYDSRNNILSAPDWLFEILESSERTVDMVDLTKYLLYKATNDEDFGVTEYDFSIFEPDDFIIINQGESGTSTGIYGETIEEKVWFALREQGYSEYTTAGAMGNIYAESGFNNNAVEGGYDEYNGGIGICQWTNYPRDSGTGRNQQLRDYAQSKGKEWQDANTQIEFLITELSQGATGPAQGYANYQLLSYNGYNGDMWENASSPEEAAVAFCWAFERPSSPNIEKRQEKAREYYEQFKGKTKPTGGSSNSILAACNEVTQEFLNRNARYSVADTELISGDIERCWTDSKSICCATYVSLVLYRSGALTPEQINAYNYHWTGSGGIPDMLKAAGWHQVSASEAQPGDVVVDYTVHAMIYAGNGKVWDQSSCVISSSGNPPTRSETQYNISSCQVWRAP